MSSVADHAPHRTRHARTQAERPTKETQAEARRARVFINRQIDAYHAMNTPAATVCARALEGTLDAIASAVEHGHRSPTLADHVDRCAIYEEERRQEKRYERVWDGGHRAGYEMGRAERGGAA